MFLELYIISLNSLNIFVVIISNYLSAISSKLFSLEAISVGIVLLGEDMKSWLFMLLLLLLVFAHGECSLIVGY